MEAATEPVIEKFQIIDDEPCYEKPAEMIIVKLGKTGIDVNSVFCDKIKMMFIQINRNLVRKLIYENVEKS